MHLPDYNCVLCGLNIEEDLAHLLFHCPFSVTCWSTLQLVLPNFGFIVECFKLQLGLPLFMEVIITMSWAIWMVQNDVIFKGIPQSVSHCKQIFKSEFALVKLRAKAAYHPRIGCKPLCNLSYFVFNLFFCCLLKTFVSLYNFNFKSINFSRGQSPPVS